MTMRVLEMIPDALLAWEPYYIKEHLKSCGWTAPSSGDGTTYNAGADIITHGGAGAGGLGNTNAWFCLRAPNGAVEITIQRTNSNSLYRIKLGRAAFNAGSPSATRTPATTTATDEILVNGGGTDAAPTGASTGWGGGSNGAQHLKGAADDEAPYGFWFARCTASLYGTLQPGFICFDPLTNTIAGDAFPYVMLVKVNDLLQNVLTLDVPATQFTYVASATPATSVVMPIQTIYDATNLSVPGDIMSTDEGLFRAFQMTYARRAALANPGYKGVSSMMKWVSPRPGRWQTLSIDAPNDWITYGDCALPWGGERAVI
jgi:hypothetical protein